LIGQQTLRRGDDGDAETPEHLRKATRLGVHPQAWLGDPAHSGDRTLTVLAVLQGDRQCLADMAFVGLVHRVTGDIALIGQDLSYANFDLAMWHDRRLVVRLAGVSDPG